MNLSTRLVVLLADGVERSGEDIIEEMGRQGVVFARIRIYAHLSRLVDEGILVQREEDLIQDLQRANCDEEVREEVLRIAPFLIPRKFFRMAMAGKRY